MDRCKLEKNGSNFNDWDAQLRLAAEGDDKLQYLTAAPPATLNARSSTAARETYETYQKQSAAVKNIMIFSMESDLERSAIKLSTAYEIYARLVIMFSQAPRIIHYEAASQFFSLNIKEGQKVSPHVLKMIKHVETLKLQGVEIPEQLVIDRVLHSLSRIKGYVQFRVNYNMQNLKTDLHELHKVLVQAERDMRLNASTSKDVLNINAKSKGKFKKSANKGKKPTPYKVKGKAIENSSPKPKKGATSDDKCHYCNGMGH
ncbi:uncharacterized protein LOC141649144 [Silene latifolia]|uniref:uncharacterized protein LOC141649144 n=1 Tax=Silene latifolia TaxID=37657 RepID=UPI003D77EEDB